MRPGNDYLQLEPRMSRNRRHGRLKQSVFRTAAGDDGEAAASLSAAIAHASMFQASTESAGISTFVRLPMIRESSLGGMPVPGRFRHTAPSAITSPRAIVR